MKRPAIARPFLRLWDVWARRRERHAAAVLDELKIRYHTFRAILANNEHCLELINSLDMRSRSLGQPWPGLPGEVEDLLHVSYELVDGLNRLSGYRFEGLYGRQRLLSQRIHTALDAMGDAAARRPARLTLAEADQEDVATVGGKAKALGRLIRLGLSVPGGFVITVDAGRRFLVDSGINFSLHNRLRRLEAQSADSSRIRAEADAIRDDILGAELTPELRQEFAEAYARLTREGEENTPVSLRSSAVLEDAAGHSFAGQFSTVLNVRGLDELIRAYKTVLASNFNARSVSYRLRHGMPLTGADMAVICQRMVPARAAGVLFSVDPSDPSGERALLTAVPGLGLAAVDGEAPADVYRPFRVDLEGSRPIERRLAHKTERKVAAPDGGVAVEALSEAEADQALLTDEQIRTLLGYGRMAEAFFGSPQDMEWALDATGRLRVLQSRPLHLGARRRADAPEAEGRLLLKGGVMSSSGRGVGRVRFIRDAKDLERGPEGPVAAVMRQSLVRAARWMPDFQAVVVELGNPADHLSNVAREYGVPMLTSATDATKLLPDGQWVLVDADQGAVREIDPALGQSIAELWRDRDEDQEEAPVEPRASNMPPELKRLRDLVAPLNLTDAYGATFSIMECRSLHDIVRYVHEKAVLEMFESGDMALEEASGVVHRLRSRVPFHFFVIDLGAGLAPETKGMLIDVSAVRSLPFLALWKGVETPGLRWGSPPPNANISGLFSRSLLDSGGQRPLGSSNYALITSDYLNLNARVDYHFAMIDALSGLNPRENYIRFRFKGGGAEPRQRERRAAFISDVLLAHGFFVDQRGDLVTAAYLEAERDEVLSRLTMLGKLLGFSRLLDASMLDEEAPGRVATAFLHEDFGLESLNAE